MSDMVERVAKALLLFETPPDYLNTALDGGWTHLLDEKGRDYWRAKARAAIEAMQDPTKEMIEQFEWHKPQEAARWYWGWMVNAALISSAPASTLVCPID